MKFFPTEGSFLRLRRIVFYRLNRVSGSRHTEFDLNLSPKAHMSSFEGKISSDYYPFSGLFPGFDNQAFRGLGL